MGGTPAPKQYLCGRYRVLSELGAGAMGVVYQAHDEHLERQVALKFLPPGSLSDPHARKRFRHEALALAKLNHPNIATIFDFESEGESDFLVIEFIPGVTIDQKLQSGPLEEREVLRLGEQLAAGLAAAHECGVLHRDLKPANLRVSPDGLLKILDFGLAKLLNVSDRTVDPARTVESVAGMTGFAGTPPYMAPEQMRAGTIDVRTDIYGAGAVLYELACGCRAFPQSGVALAEAVLHSLPTPPRTLAKVSTALESVILKALSKDPAGRQQNARELLEDLRHISTRPSPRRRSRAVDSIAVLPFENATGEQDTEYLSEGLTDTLIHELSAVPEFKKVIARSSVYRYRGRDIRAEQVGRELDVRSVLLGRIVRRADFLHINVELVDTSNSRHIWGADYDRCASEISDLQHALAADISQNLGLKLRRKPKTHSPANPESYNLYLKGRYFWNKRPGAGMVQRAIENFEQATELDPTFALGYAGLADCYNTLGAWEASALAPQVAFPQARMAAARALRLDPQLAEAHSAQAYSALHFDWDWAQAQQGFRRALQLNPNYVHAHHWYAHCLIAIGKPEEALAESLTIIELDPFDMIINAHLAWHYLMAHDFPRALEAADKTLDMDRNAIWAEFFAGCAYEQLGELDKAVDSLRRSAELSGSSVVMMTSLGHALARAGDHTAARRVIAELESAAGTRYVPAYALGLIHLALGEEEHGWQLLEHACQEHSGWMPYLHAEPRLTHAHGHPRFQALLARIGLPAAKSAK